MPNKSYLISIPVLTTAHITEATNLLLTRDGDSISWAYCAVYELGYFLSVPNSDDFPSTLPPAPNDLIEIWKWARSENHTWIRLANPAVGTDALNTLDRRQAGQPLCSRQQVG